MPKWVSKMKRQKTPVTTDATAHGIITAIRNSPEPRNGRLRMSAVSSASGMVTAVTAAAKPRVRGIDCEHHRVDGQALRKLRRPTNGRQRVLGQLDAEEAQAEHREDRRQHEDRDQQQRRDRHEQRELPLAEAVEAARDGAADAATRGADDCHPELCRLPIPTMTEHPGGLTRTVAAPDAARQ